MYCMQVFEGLCGNSLHVDPPDILNKAVTPEDVMSRIVETDVEMGIRKRVT